jgi:hypothetical protein
LEAARAFTSVRADLPQYEISLTRVAFFARDQLKLAPPEAATGCLFTIDSKKVSAGALSVKYWLLNLKTQLPS